MQVVLALFASLSFGCLVAPAYGYSSFRDQIPNGYKVVSPCNSVVMWDGVGHENYQGGGSLNDFGEDFRDLGASWNDDICMKDSDGDGMTNGFELGDPDCKWSAGDTPSRTYNITHPGICDPFDSEQCRSKNDFVNCEGEKFVCPQINSTDVTRKELEFLEFTVPSTETNYYCMTFDLPVDQDYHVIATEPMIDQEELVHHIIIYGCSESNNAKLDSPTKCGMEASEDCDTVIGLWSFGLAGVCYGDLGFRIGQSAIKTIKLEIHYNNPMNYEGLTDKSGMAIYYKPAKDDVQDLVTLWVGTMLLEIPPGESAYDVHSSCKSGCTYSMINQPAKIWGAFNHMHYLGSAMRIELFRNGEKVQDVTWEDDYDYDDPVLHMQEPALDLLPGDELRTTCTYNTEKTDHYVRYGEATSDEMCFGFLFAYPRNAFNFEYCLSYQDLDVCDLYAGNPLRTSNGDCYLSSFVGDENNLPSWMIQVGEHCSEDGYCRSDCKNTVESLMQQEACLSKEASLLVSWGLDRGVGHRALAALNTCRGLIWSGDDGSSGSDQCTYDDCVGVCPSSTYNSAHGLTVSVLVLTSSVGLSLLSYRQ